MESDRTAGGGDEPVSSLELIERLDGDAPSDASLLQRFINLRDEAAFAELVRRHQSLVMNAAWRILRNAQLAEDAFQETFLALARRARTVRVPDSLAGWLHRVAANAALQMRIRGQRRHHRETLAGVDEATPPPTQEADDLRRLVDKTLDEMPEKYRLPLILCYLQGLTNETAAVRLGRPKGSMSTLIARGLELMRDALRRKGILAAPAALMAALAGSQAQAAAPALVAAVVRAAAATGLGATAVSGGALGWFAAAELKAAVAAALLAAGAVGGGLFAAPPAEPALPAVLATVLPPTVLPPRAAVSSVPPDPAALRPAVPPAAPAPESADAPGPAPEKSEKKNAEKESGPAPKAAEAPGPRAPEALPPLPDLPDEAADRARAALEHALERRLERGRSGEAPSTAAGKPAKDNAGKGGPSSGMTGLERAAEAGRAASRAAEQAHQAQQKTRGRSGK